MNLSSNTRTLLHTSAMLKSVLPYARTSCKFCISGQYGRSVHSLQAGSNGEGPVSAGCHATLAPSGEETLSLCGRRMVQPIVRPAQPRIIGILS